MTAYLVDARVTIWKPEASPESEFGSYFGGPVPGSLVIEGLRIAWSIEKDDQTTANKASVMITNLSEQSRSELSRLPLRLVLEAGYAGRLSVLFAGDVTLSPGSTYDGTTWTTELLAKDGGRALKHARVNKSLRGRPTALTLAQECIAALGLRAPANLAGFAELKKEYPQGAVIYGLASDQLSQLLAPYGIEWSIQNGQIKASKRNTSTGDLRTIVDEDAGLVGSPEIAPPSSPGEHPTLTFQTLLFPELEPGTRIRLRSKTESGDFKLTSVKHEGSNKDDGATTTCEGRPI